MQEIFSLPFLLDKIFLPWKSMFVLNNRGHDMQPVKKYLISVLVIALAFGAFAQEKKKKETKYYPYYYQKKTLFEKLPDTKGEIIFLGDSITDGGSWIELFQDIRIKNRGISGDVTDGVLDRLDEVTRSHPAKVFLMIGINDLAAGKSADYVVSNIGKIVKNIRKSSPETEIYVQSLLPVNSDFGMFKNHTDMTEAVISINKKLKKQAEIFKITYIDVYSSFTCEGNKLNPDYSNDGLHLTGDGYIVWKSLLEPYVKNKH